VESIDTAIAAKIEACQMVIGEIEFLDAVIAAEVEGGQLVRIYCKVLNSIVAAQVELCQLVPANAETDQNGEIRDIDGLEQIGKQVEFDQGSWQLVFAGCLDRVIGCRELL
jgi:hypothetical protein